MYTLLVEKTQAKGFRRYEISNFALEGHESKHNLRYWNNEEYLAFGVGAHRYVNGVRSANLRSLKKYMANALALDLEEPIDSATRLKEAIFLGLRKAEGISVLDFKERFNLDLHEAYGKQIAKYVQGGFLDDDGKSIKLTLDGVLVSNSIMVDFM
jgi:oxygen-independent coproporphyrinogen-3 oxidase